MFEENKFDYENYIQKRLREIDDLDERKYAKELLLEGLGNILKWTETKYAALEQRIQRELDMQGERFCTYMTIVEKKDYDPINPFWLPVCAEDLKEDKSQGYKTVYLMADEEGVKEFSKLETVDGIEENSGRTIRFQVRKAERYKTAVKGLYRLFSDNHISWQSIPMGHLERFFDLIPQEELSRGAEISISWGEWATQVKKEMLPLWNVQRAEINSWEFRTPCIDEVFYEHVLYLPAEWAEEDGYLIDADEEILSVRYEKNKVVLKAKQDSLKEVHICRMHQGGAVKSYGYQYTVLSNCKKDNMAARYLQRMGNFLQTPAELYRKIMEMTGGFQVELLGYEIVGRDEKILAAGKILNGDMNNFVQTQVFSDDKRSILLFRIRMEEKRDYLWESQVRYILSQLQIEFMEYRCMGVLV